MNETNIKEVTNPKTALVLIPGKDFGLGTIIVPMIHDDKYLMMRSDRF